jgi:hypothetical protein
MKGSLVICKKRFNVYVCSVLSAIIEGKKSCLLKHLHQKFHVQRIAHFKMNTSHLQSFELIGILCIHFMSVRHSDPTNNSNKECKDDTTYHTNYNFASFPRKEKLLSCCLSTEINVLAFSCLCHRLSDTSLDASMSWSDWTSSITQSWSRDDYLCIKFLLFHSSFCSELFVTGREKVIRIFESWHWNILRRFLLRRIFTRTFVMDKNGPIRGLNMMYISKAWKSAR